MTQSRLGSLAVVIDAWTALVTYVFFAETLARDLYFLTDFWGDRLLEEPTAELHHHSRRRRTTAGSHIALVVSHNFRPAAHTRAHAHVR